jgi:hypothetical protein
VGGGKIARAVARLVMEYDSKYRGVALLIQGSDLPAASGGAETRGDDLEALDAVGRGAPANLFYQLQRPSRRALRTLRYSGIELVDMLAAFLVG